MCSSDLVIEMLKGFALGMARNNRTELLDRLAERGVELLDDTRLVSIQGRSLAVEIAGKPRSIDAGDVLMTAIGPRPNLDVLPALDAAGVEYVTVGDCYKPGDFLSCLRDAWMVALSVDERFTGNRTARAPALRP